MLTSRIVGTGMAAPERTVDNREIGSALGVPPEQIHRLTGIRSRRWVSGHESASDLAVEASRRNRCSTSLRGARPARKPGT